MVGDLPFTRGCAALLPERDAQRVAIDILEVEVHPVLALADGGVERALEYFDALALANEVLVGQSVDLGQEIFGDPGSLGDPSECVAGVDGVPGDQRVILDHGPCEKGAIRQLDERLAGQPGVRGTQSGVQGSVDAVSSFEELVVPLGLEPGAQLAAGLGGVGCGRRPGCRSGAGRDEFDDRFRAGRADRPGGGRLGLVRLSRRRGSRDGFGADRGSGGRCLLRRWGDQLEGELLPAGNSLLG